MTKEAILARFPKHSRTLAGIIAQCPAHEDKGMALLITNGKGRINLKCGAGCTEESILAKLGLGAGDLLTEGVTQSGPKNQDASKGHPVKLYMEQGPQKPPERRLLMDRLPPHSQEAEAGILGCCLLDNSKLDECRDLLIEKDSFYDLRHATIYAAMQAMHSRQEVVDIITLQQTLKDQGRLDEIGGIAYLSSLPDQTPSAANLSYYADIVYEKHLVRQMLTTCTRAVNRIYEDCTLEGIDAIEREVLGVRASQRKKSRTIKQLANEAIEEIERLWQFNGAISGISSGLPSLDKMTFGFQPGDMIVIGAYPSCGKTSLAMNIAEHVAVDQRLAVGVFSLEMGELRLVMRMIAARANVNIRGVRTADGDCKTLLDAAKQIAKAPLFIEHYADLSIYDLRAKARRMKKEHDIKLWIVDYLQLLNATAKRCETRQLEVAEISKGIKALAGETQSPVIALSQLNDDGKLKESRAISQDADIIMRLNADEKHETHALLPVNVEFKKNRDGARGGDPIQLHFLKTITKFVEKTE